MARNKLMKLLSREDKGINSTHGVSGVLSKLFRQILYDINIGPQKWGNYMRDYLSDSRNNVPNNRRDMSSIQGNLTKELSRTEMTWKVFCKGVRFLQITKFELAIKTYRKHGPSMVHSITVDLSDSIGEIDDKPFESSNNSKGPTC